MGGRETPWQSASRIAQTPSPKRQRRFGHGLQFTPQKVILFFMDAGEIIYTTSRLVLGALSSFFAIRLWSKTRDVAWMLMVIGTIAAYIETVYSILDMFGITRGDTFVIGSIPVAAIVLPSLRTAFFIIAFLIMVVRKYGRR
jgi:hypothetical protein